VMGIIEGVSTGEMTALMIYASTCLLIYSCIP
jgi:hypothetical protein